VRRWGMERTHSVVGECHNPAVRTFALGRGLHRLYTGRRDSWQKPLRADGCGHSMKIVARYGVFREGGDPSKRDTRLGSVYIERKLIGTRPHFRAVVAPCAETRPKFAAMGLRFAGGFARNQHQVEHDQVPKALAIVEDFLTRSGLRWELNGHRPEDTEPGDE